MNKINYKQRLQLLFAELNNHGFDGFIVPHADEFQGEYIPASAQRLAWLTGFTGSAGLAIVHPDESAIFVDGRYTLAVRDQVDTFQPYDYSSLTEWLKKQSSVKLAYDPWLHTLNDLALFKDVELVPCETNPIDTIWLDQPEPPLAPVVPYPSDTKREQVILDDGIDAVMLTAPDSIAWLLNIRGGDVPRAPLPLCFAILYANKHVDLFIDQRKINVGWVERSETHHLGGSVGFASLYPPYMIEKHLTENDVTIYEFTDLAIILDKLNQSTVLIDPKQTPIWIIKRLNKIVKGDDPCALPKACKNSIEIAGTRVAHLRDGSALTRFLYWLKPGVDEIQAAERLEQFRAETGLLHDLSFDTISGYGANGAIVHYQVTPETNKVLETGNLYLVDSGGQYLDGTTDVTRTIAIGRPTAEHKDRFTRVLKGHISIATCRFPEGTTGTQLDILARHALWQVGLDYQHGTGHGVGFFLSVHEGPQSISKRINKVALKPGMIISNEPGYYKAGAYGIRIENLVLVTEASEIEGGEQPMMGFETLTLAPIDRNLIEVKLLNEKEIEWINNYHARVYEKIAPTLKDEQERQWLAEATATIY
jgi:Xaa-Pro aminopeptidase